MLYVRIAARYTYSRKKKKMIMIIFAHEIVIPGGARLPCRKTLRNIVSTLNVFPIGGRSQTEFLEPRRHSEPSCSSSLENRKPQANDGNIREFCSGGGSRLPRPPPFPAVLSHLPTSESTRRYPLDRGQNCVCTQRVFTARSLAAGQKRSLHPCVARHRLA